MWYFFEDKAWLKEENLKKLNDIVLILSKTELTPQKLEDILKNDKNVLAPFLPPEDIAHLFKVENLPNLKSPFTTEEFKWINEANSEAERERRKAQVLEEKLGLKIYIPKIKLSQLGGMQNLKRYVEYVKILEEEGSNDLKVKGIFLVGIAGTGKSFSAKAVSGELNRHLVELNLSKIMESPNPIFTLHKVFQYLEKLSLKDGLKFILWIDEIEKMFASLEGIEKKVLGQLLTILNDLNSEEGYKIDAIFWATANDIKAIMERNPEFLRSGRFDKLFFVDAPCYPNEAIDIFKIYFKKFNLPESDNPKFWEQLTDLAQHIVWGNLTRDYSDIKAKVFIYTPAEIMQLNKEVKRDLLLFYASLYPEKDLKEFSSDSFAILDFLNELDNLVDKNLKANLEKYLGEKIKFFSRYIEILENKHSEVNYFEGYERQLLAFFYEEMHNVSPILRTAKKTITDLRGLKNEYFTPVSECL